VYYSYSEGVLLDYRRCSLRLMCTIEGALLFYCMPANVFQHCPPPLSFWSLYFLILFLVQNNVSMSKKMALCQKKWLYVKTNGSKHEPILVTQTLTSRAGLVCGNYLFTHNMFSLELPVTKPKRTVAISWHVSSSKISTPSTLNPKPSTLNPKP